MKTAKQIIIELINSKKINGDEAYTLITSLKENNSEYKGITIFNYFFIFWYPHNIDYQNYKLKSK